MISGIVGVIIPVFELIQVFLLNLLLISLFNVSYWIESGGIQTRFTARVVTFI